MPNPRRSDPAVLSVSVTGAALGAPLPAVRRWTRPHPRGWWGVWWREWRFACCDVAVTVRDIDSAELRLVAEQLAAEAAEFVRLRRSEVFGAGRPDPGDAAVHSKSTRTDPVTVVDTETEQLLRSRLARLRPGESVLGEEGGGQADDPGGRSVTWVLDPIDGTVNFVYAIPAYAVSVAAQVDGVSVAGAVAEVTAARVCSAGLRVGAHVIDAAGRRDALHCNTIDDLSMALVGTGFGYSPRRPAGQGALLGGVVPHVGALRT